MEHTEQQIWAGRVLDLTRAAALYRDLAGHAESLNSGLDRDIYGPDSDDVATLAEAISGLHETTADTWLKHDPVAWGPHEITRTAALRAARTAARRAEAAAETATALAFALEALEPFDTYDRLVGLIERAGYEDGHDLTDLWHRLGPTDLIAPDTANELRRAFDEAIDTSTDPVLTEAVTTWRAQYLSGQHGPVRFDVATCRYIIDTHRSWQEIADLWETLPNAVTGHDATAADAIAIRDAIRDAVLADRPDDLPTALAEGLRAYDTDPTALAARVRHADGLDGLRRVWDVLHNSSDFDHLSIIRALARAARALARETGDPLASDFAGILDQWRCHVLNVAVDRIGAGVGEHYSTDEAYTLIYQAAAAAEDVGDTASLDQIRQSAARAADAGRLTGDQHSRLNAILDPETTIPA